MQNELDIGGVRYLSAQEAARMLGYTNDYISRLCREGKISGKRMGKNWMVNEVSLIEFAKIHEEKKSAWHTSLSEELRSVAAQNEPYEPMPQLLVAPHAQIQAELAKKNSRIGLVSMPTAPTLAVLSFVAIFSVALYATTPVSGSQVAASAFGEQLSQAIHSAFSTLTDRVRSFSSWEENSESVVTVQIVPSKRVTYTHTPSSVPTSTISQPITERIIERITHETLSGVSEQMLTARIAALDSTLSNRINALSLATTYSSNRAADNVADQIRFDELSSIDILSSDWIGGTITDAAISGGSITGVTIGVSNLSGVVPVANGGTGTSTYTAGDLLYADTATSLDTLSIGANGQVLKVVGGALSWAADLSGGAGGGGVWATTTDDLAIYPVDTTDVVLIGANATSTTGNILEVLGSSLFRGALTAYNTITAPIFTATSTTATSTLPNVSASNLTVSTLASTSQLVASNSFTFGTVTGFLKATAGVVATSLINLAADVTGILPVANGGTGWNAIQAGSLLYGNAGNALATTTAGTNGQILALAGGVPTWVASTTFSSPLVYTNGIVTVQDAVADGTTKGAASFTANDFNSASGNISIDYTNGQEASASQDGFLSSTHWTLFNNKVSSTSLDTYFTNNRDWNVVANNYLAPTTTRGIIVSASSTITSLSTTLSTSTNATSTNLFSSFANFTQATTTSFAISGITPNSLLKTTTGGALVAAVAGTDYANFGYLFPSNATTTGLGIYASTTIGAGGQTTGLTISGGATTTGLLYVSGSGTSTIAENLNVMGQLKVGTGSIFLNGSATSTFSHGIQSSALNITSSSASSTFANGINLSAGCFSVNGTCVGTAGGSGTVGSGTTGQFPYYAADGTTLTATSSLFLATSGNVGIGTTTPTSLLDVYGARSAGANVDFIRINSSGHGGTVADAASLAFTNGAGGNTVARIQSVVSANSFDLAFHTGETISEKMRIMASGNVGIGTTTPSRKLSVIGDILIDASASAQLRFQNAGVFKGALQYDASNDNIDIYSAGSGSLPRISVQSGGNVGIASTSPYAKLSVTNTGTGPSFIVEDSTSPDTTPFIIDASGNVGIGSTTPSAHLAISATNALIRAADPSTNIPGISLQQYGASGRDWRVETGRSAVGEFNISDCSASCARRLLIDDAGNIGIATATPISTLSIQGSLCVRSTGSCGNAAGTIYATTATISDIDLAENYTALDLTLMPGEIVALESAASSTIRRAQRGDEALGILSTKPGLLLGQEIANGKAVALKGRVPLKVNMEGGPIAVGDRLLISSQPGIGTKATTSAYTVARALEATASDGTIEAFVENEYTFVLGERDMLTALAAPASTTPTTPVFVNLFARIAGWLADASNGITELFAKNIHAENVYADTVNAKKLCLEDVCVTKAKLQALLNGSSQPAAASTPPAPSPAPTLEPAPDASASSTPSDAGQTPTVSESPVEPVPDATTAEEPAVTPAPETTEVAPEAQPAPDPTTSPAPAE